MLLNGLCHSRGELAVNCLTPANAIMIRLSTRLISDASVCDATSSFKSTSACLLSEAAESANIDSSNGLELMAKRDTSRPKV